MTNDERKIMRAIQKDILFWIIKGLKSGVLTQEYVKSLALETLSATRKATLEECFDAFFETAEKFSEANRVFVKNAREYYKNVTNIRLSNGRRHITINDYDRAVIALRGGGN